MFLLYKALFYLATPFLILMLNARIKKGKEDSERIKERYGVASIPCPKGSLIWFHAASVGEAQSTLILIDKILQQSPSTHILVTTGTVTSANLMQARLPSQAFHQYAPLDHPLWVNRFLEHWQPDLALRMESELWPTTLLTLKAQRIPTVLINARLSDNSFKKWNMLKGSAKKLLSSFSLILTQSENDAILFKKLGADNVKPTGNIKYSAEPLPCDKNELNSLSNQIKGRPSWVYASTHDGEEEIACEIHKTLSVKHPSLLTIIVPRHPERRDEIAGKLNKFDLNVDLRGEQKTPPNDNTNIYIADTLGELGLFYRLSPIAVIGKSFSHDGGGHNPIEAAQLDCAVLTGPKTHLLKDIFHEMNNAGAVSELPSPKELTAKLDELFSTPALLEEMCGKAKEFVENQTSVIDNILSEIALP